MISISHVLGAFFLILFLPNFFSIKLHTSNSLTGDRFVLILMTTLINFGFDGFGDETWKVMRDNEIEDETIEVIDSVEAKEVLSKTCLKSVQEVKSIHPVKTIQEVKNLYELMEKQVEQLIFSFSSLTKNKNNSIL